MLVKPWKLPVLPAALLRERRAPAGRARVPEPMVMDEPEAVAEFHAAGRELNVGVYEFNARALDRLLPGGGTLLDLGSGSAQFLSRLAQHRPDLRIVGLDLSDEMLETGRQRLAEVGVADRVELRKGDITDFEAHMPDGVDCVSCVWALHHLPTDDLVAACFRCLRATRDRTGCGIWLFDFVRYRDPRTWPAIFGMFHSPGPILTRDALASEQAALTYDEMRKLLEASGLGELRSAQSGGLRMYQCHWVPAREAATGDGAWVDLPLPRELRIFAAMMARDFPGDVGT